MNNSVLIPVHPKWCELIANGKKTVEVRKTRPKIDTPFKCYIYCTKPNKSSDMLWLSEKFGYITASEGAIYNKDYSRVGNGKVIGEFVCDKIIHWSEEEAPPIPLKETALTYPEIRKYSPSGDLYLWHISDLVIYDKPKELSEFVVPSKFGCCNEGKCKGCTFLDRGNGFNIEDDCNAPFCTDEYKPLRRAPQSWCYVNLI